MIYQWHLPTGTLPIERRHREADLVEIDGPQLILANDGTGRRYLGLFADRPDESRELWLYAPLTDLELEALVAGAVSMRSVMSKPLLDLVEHRDDRVIAMWQIALEDVPAGILPAPDANLPVENGDALLAQLLGKELPKAGTRIFRCGGRPVRGSDIAFGALSGIAGALQSLWSAIANDVLPAPRTPDEVTYLAEAQTLRMSRSMAASFGIVVEPANAEPFAKIAGRYRALARLLPNDLSTASVSPAVLSSYQLFLKTLANLDAEVFAQLGEAQAYIGSAHAERLAKAIRVALGPPNDLPLMPVSLTARGFFHAADIGKRTFVFFDAITNQEIRGKIAKDIAESLKTRNQEIRVGNQTLYDVHIERRGARAAFTLAKLHPAGEPAFPAKGRTSSL